MRAAPLSLPPSLSPPSPVLDSSDNFLFVCICARKPRVKRVKVPKTKRKLAVCARAQRVEMRGRDTAQPHTLAHKQSEGAAVTSLSLWPPPEKHFAATVAVKLRVILCVISGLMRRHWQELVSYPRGLSAIPLSLPPALPCPGRGNAFNDVAQ